MLKLPKIPGKKTPVWIEQLIIPICIFIVYYSKLVFLKPKVCFYCLYNKQHLTYNKFLQHFISFVRIFFFLLIPIVSKMTLISKQKSNWWSSVQRKQIMYLSCLYSRYVCAYVKCLAFSWRCIFFMCDRTSCIMYQLVIQYTSTIYPEKTLLFIIGLSPAFQEINL